MMVMTEAETRHTQPASVGLPTWHPWIIPARLLLSLIAAHRTEERTIVAVDPSKTRTLKVTKSYQTTPQQAAALEAAALREGVAQQQIVARAIANELGRLGRSTWGTVDGVDEYDPMAFYTQGTDAKGHSAEVRVRIPVPLRGEIQGLIESGVVPQYRTAQDFARDAIHHRAKQIARMVEDGGLERAVDMSMLMADEMQMRHQAAEAAELIRTTDENLKGLYDHAHATQDFQRIREYLGDRADKAEVIPEAYRQQYIDMLAGWKKKIRNR